MNAKLVEPRATLYAQPNPQAPPLMQLVEGQEFTITASGVYDDQTWLSVTLPDRTLGYLTGDIAIFRYTITRLRKETNVYAAPSLQSMVVVRYGEGATLLEIGDVTVEGQTWVQVRDGDGLEGYIAEDTVAGAGTGSGRRPSRSDIQAAHARANMRTGAIMCIGGIAITWITYSLAANGGTYVVAWGAIVFGAIRFMNGVIQLP
jgi:Bacterial SH3 domain